jgi:hypothetical protein
VRPAAKQASVDCRFPRPEPARGLLVGETEQIDGDDGVPIYAGDGGDRGDDTARVHGCREVDRREEIHAGHRHRFGTSRGEAAANDVRVAKRSEKVGQVIATAQLPRAREDARKGLLDQVLSLVVRTAQRARGSVENSAMGDQGPRVEEACLV